MLTAMTTFPAGARASRGLVDLAAAFYRREPLFAATGLFLAALMLPTAFALLVETRTLADINLWIKPLKFEAALSVYLLTLAWFAGWLPQGMTERRRYRAYARIVVAAIIAEMTWIGAAAALGVASHFNRSSALWSGLYMIMGAGAVILTSATLVYGVQIHRNGSSALPPAFKASVVYGLVLTFALTLVAAGYMGSAGSHLVGGNLSDAESAPIFGWARDGGDLRVAHFLATHAMHVIPVFGLISTRIFGRANLLPVRLFALGYVVLTALTLLQALAGLPFMARSD